MIAFLKNLFRWRATPPAQPNRHERFASKGFYQSLRVVAESLAKTDPDGLRFDLGIPEARFQGNSPRCTAESALGGAEILRRTHGSDLFPVVDWRAVYKDATARDGLADVGGSWLHKAADAYCELAGSGIGWVRIPLDPITLLSVMLVQKTPILYGFEFHKTDRATGASGRVMVPGNGKGAGHAVVLYGYEPEVEYKRYPWEEAVKTDCFLLRNTNTAHDRDHRGRPIPWLYPISRARKEKGAIEAIMFTLPNQPL